MGLLVNTKVEDALGAYQSQFEYDGLHQLIQEKGLYENNYQYDSLKNHRDKNGAAHQIDTLNQLAHDGVRAYDHDMNGRRTQKEDAQYTYDALGRLVTFRKGDVQLEYQYDPLGRRISCRSTDCIQYYLYQHQADRILIATTKEFNAVLVTSDEKILAFGQD